MAATLGGCVPDQGLVGAAATKPPVTPVVSELGSDIYVAMQDGPYTVPAIPLDKLPVEYRRQAVAFPTSERPGTVIINPAARQLHLVTGPNEALRYGIAVGKDGFQWSGEAVVARRKPWPNWTPPPEMIARKPELAKWAGGQPGGPTNPLGARALYLTSNGVDYGYRIHGTPEWQSIGRNASSGCIRMINQDIIDLYNRVPDGAKVVVLTSAGAYPTKLSLPPAPKTAAKPKPAPAPEPVPAAAEPEAYVTPVVGPV